MRFHVIDLLLSLGLALSPSSAPATVAADLNEIEPEGMKTQHVPLSLLQSNQEKRKKAGEPFQGPEVPSPKTFDQQYVQVLCWE